MAQSDSEKKQDPAERDEPEPIIHPDLTTREVHRGAHQGDKYVRVVRSDALRRVAPGYLRASEQISRPTRGVGLLYRQLKVWLVGKPLPTIAEKDERLNKLRALAVFSSDAISSSAYATEEILLVLVAAGLLGLPYALPIAFGIAILLAIVSFSYRQTVHAYPHGGGSYTVSKENLGTQAGLIAASALLIDYVLTVAVSIAAGTAAITSAMPSLFAYRVEISIFFIAIITLINLRGIRESGTIFALPTYLFIFMLAGVIVLGATRIFTGQVVHVEPHFEHTTFEPITLFLILHAFAAGSVAMSGTEAIANGVPAFKEPESKNAAATLIWMSSILGVFFVGVTWLANQFGIVPSETETVISQVGRTVFGPGAVYGIFQVATMMILVLAANTSFNGFPRLFSVLARDGFAPHQFLFRGDRLAFSYGIIVLGALAAVLIVVFGGSTHALIPLYAVGVFLSFTLSQSGMVLHWWRLREPGWQRSMTINAAGALATGIVLLVVGTVKFQLGAWMVVLLIPILVALFNLVHLHYRHVADQLSVMRLVKKIATPRQIVIVPIGEVNMVTLRALAFARSIAKEPLAVHITYDANDVEEFRARWKEWGNGTQLVLLESPYRSFTEPLLAYIDALHHQDPDAYLTLVLPEFLPAHWWEHLLHNQTALRLKASLLFRRNTVVVSVPYHLER
ncbi:MAG: APC family permease [Chloroflexi bacterium]|nr:APC family permease [Chloroflexota bacterium]